MRKLRLCLIPLLLLGPASLNLVNRIVAAAQFPPIEDLAIDASPFPPGWVADAADTDFPPLAPCSTGRPEVEYLSRRYYIDSESAYARAFLRIERYRAVGTARDWYDRDIATAFREAKWNTGWSIPDGLDFESPVASHYRVGCTVEGTEGLARPRCAYIAQYGLYVLEFYVDFEVSDEFSYSDLPVICQAIDRRMAEAASLR
jgi:hypothetical protein